MGNRDLMCIDETVPRYLTFVTLSSCGDARCIIDYLRCDGSLRKVKSKELNNTRIGMCVRDLLCGYSHGCAVAVIDPQLEKATASLECMKFVSSLATLTSNYDGPYLNSPMNKNSSAIAAWDDDHDDIDEYEEERNGHGQLQIEQLSSAGGGELEMEGRKTKFRNNNSNNANNKLNIRNSNNTDLHVQGLTHSLEESNNKLKDAKSHNTTLEITMGNLKYENAQLKEQLSGQEGVTLRR